MSISIDREIDDYLYRMRMIKESILSLQGELLLENHKKTLLLSLLDTMSKGIYGDSYRRNHVRFKTFIIQFCDWKDANRVSLQQMALLLEKMDDERLMNIKEYTHQELLKYPPSTPVTFNKDPLEEEVKAILISNNVHNQINLSDLVHVNLLWNYRNVLVHEARSKGADKLFDYENEPHYIHYKELKHDNMGNVITEEYWEIYYPSEFFIVLIDKAICNVRPYLIENGINPFENYDFDPLWIKVN